MCHRTCGTKGLKTALAKDTPATMAGKMALVTTRIRASSNTAVEPEAVEMEVVVTAMTVVAANTVPATEREVTSLEAAAAAAMGADATMAVAEVEVVAVMVAMAEPMAAITMATAPVGGMAAVVVVGVVAHTAPLVPPQTQGALSGIS